MSLEPNPKPSFLARLAGLVLRLIFVTVIGIAIGAGIYFGFQAFYSQYANPLQEHALRLSTLEARLEQAEEVHQQRLEDLILRLNALEVQSDEFKEDFSGLETRIEEIEASQAAQAASSQTMLENLEGIETSINAVQREYEAQQEGIASLQGEFETGFADLETALETMQAEVDDANQVALENEQVIQDFRLEIEREMQILKTMELLTRARFNMAQGNLSLALVDIQAARKLLSELQTEGSASQEADLEEILARLDASLESLPRQPLSAADELEGAWQLLLESLPQEPPGPQFQVVPLTPEAAAARQVTLTPTP